MADKALYETSSPVLRSALEQLLEERLRHWPPAWDGYHWPGYTYEHTLRVVALVGELAAREEADQQVVEIAALLHDIRKDAGGEHARAGAEEARELLARYGIPTELAARVCDAIACHAGGNTTASPLENQVLADADLIDANFGLVGVWRFITIRAGTGASFEDTISSMAQWLPKKDALLGQLLTPSGREMARQRSARMHVLCHELLTAPVTNGDPHLISLTHAAKHFYQQCGRRSLVDQLADLEAMVASCPADPAVCALCRTFRKEIAALQ